MITELEKKLLAQAHTAMNSGATEVAVDIGDLIELLDQLTIARKSSKLIAATAVQNIGQPTGV